MEVPWAITDDEADYALWLVPASPERESTIDVIQSLIGSESDSPAFDPHVTLLHPIAKTIPIEEITTKLQNIAQQLDLRATPLWLDLQPAQAGTFYYQSVLAPVVPNDTLSALRSACQESFEQQGSKVYFPHLSLLYGDLSKERRDQLAAGVNDGKALPKSLTIKEILVVDCTGVTKDWKAVASIPLL